MSRMKNSEADLAEMDRVLNNTESKIRGYVEELEAQIEKVDEEKAALKAIKERADSEGFNVALLMQVIADKKRTREELESEHQELILYRRALGIE